MAITPDVISGAVQAVVGCAIGIVVGATTSRRNGKIHHCPDHFRIVEHITEVRTDVKWIRDQMEDHTSDEKKVGL